MGNRREGSDIEDVVPRNESQCRQSFELFLRIRSPCSQVTMYLHVYASTVGPKVSQD